MTSDRCDAKRIARVPTEYRSSKKKIDRRKEHTLVLPASVHYVRQREDLQN